MEAVWHLELGAGVVAGLIEDQDDALGRADPHRGSEGLQGDAHDRGGDARGELPFAASGGRVDEGEHVAPLEAVRHAHERPLPLARPDAAHDRFEAHPMFIGRPPLDLRLGKGRPHRRHLLA